MQGVTDFDLDGITPDDVDGFAKNGGRARAGRHHVRVDTVKPGSTPKGAEFDEIGFVIVGGPDKGCEIRESVFKTDNVNGKKRRALFASKLGLLTRKGNGWEMAPGKTGFVDCLGAECVVEIAEEEFTDKKGVKKTKMAVTWNGIWSLSDAEVKSVPKGKPGDAPAPRKAVDTAAL